jgi:hypothetical protein
MIILNIINLQCGIVTVRISTTRINMERIATASMNTARIDTARMNTAIIVKMRINTALRRKRKDWSARNQNNVSE